MPSGLRKVETARRSRSFSSPVLKTKFSGRPRGPWNSNPSWSLKYAGNVGVHPAVDRDGVGLDDAEHRDDRRGREDEPADRGQHHRAAEEVRGDEGQVVPKRVEDRLRVGLASEPALRKGRVEQDEACEDQRERIDERGAERQGLDGDRVPRDAGERDGEQHLLPGRDQCQRRSVHSQPEERGENSVVERQADDERVDGVDRAPPDGDGARRERRGVDDEREHRHGA